MSPMAHHQSSIQQNSIMLSNSSAVLNSKRDVSVTFVGFGSSAGKLHNPGASVDQSDNRYVKGGIPAIPSRFLTPVLKFDAHEQNNGYKYFDTVIGTS